MSWEKNELKIAQSKLNSVKDNFDGQKCSAHHMEGFSSEIILFLQTKPTLIEVPDMILKTGQNATTRMTVGVLEFLKTSVFQLLDYCEGLSSLEMCSKLSESIICEKLAEFEIKKH